MFIDIRIAFIEIKLKYTSINNEIYLCDCFVTVARYYCVIHYSYRSEKSIFKE